MVHPSATEYSRVNAGVPTQKGTIGTQSLHTRRHHTPVQIQPPGSIWASVAVVPSYSSDRIFSWIFHISIIHGHCSAQVSSQVIMYHGFLLCILSLLIFIDAPAQWAVLSTPVQGRQGSAAHPSICQHWTVKPRHRDEGGGEEQAKDPCCLPTAIASRQTHPRC